MASNPVIPIRRKHAAGGGPDLAAALAGAAQAHEEGQVLAAHIDQRFSLACVVLARAPRGWTVAGASGLPCGMRLHAGTHVASNVEPERWLREVSSENWVRRDLTHGRRVVARLLLGADVVPDALGEVCALAAPVLAAAYPRQAGTSPLELYLAQIIHDLRQPLSTLRLAHGLLRDNNGGESVLIDRCQRAVQDLSELMDDLLAFAGPQGSGIKRRGHVPVRLRELAAQVVDDFRAQARARELALELTARADPTVYGSPLGLKRALANVVDNAVVHSPPGARIQVVLDVDFKFTVLEVRDEGPGIPPGLRDQVFEPFFTTRSNGNGLGLAVVRLVAQSHGGLARFVDCPRGATFRLAIPHQAAANTIPV